jgi:hypothetical protein
MCVCLHTINYSYVFLDSYIFLLKTNVSNLKIYLILGSFKLLTSFAKVPLILYIIYVYSEFEKFLPSCRKFLRPTIYFGVD